MLRKTSAIDENAQDMKAICAVYIHCFKIKVADIKLCDQKMLLDIEQHGSDHKQQTHLH